MDLVVALEQRFSRAPDGSVWVRTGFDRPFWDRYLEVFDRVRIVARVLDVPAAPAESKRSDGDGVVFAPVPHYIGPWQYLMKAYQVRQCALNAVGQADAVILRVGSQIAAGIVPMLRRSRHPYGVEVIGDPHDVFAPGAVRHPLRPFFRWWFSRSLRQQCAGALGAAYVTERALQKRYPPAPGSFTTHYSSIDLPDTALVDTPRSSGWTGRGPWTILTVGTLTQLYKGPDVLIDAVSQCMNSGLDLKLVLVGDGKHRSELEARAAAAGLGDRVCFRGEVPSGAAVQAELDQADLFVLPSRTEGLPRALIEAMARALPCIGSTIGGIPELLPAEALVPPGDVGSLARKIREVVTNPDRMARMSERNLHKAREYRAELLHSRRIAFYRHVRNETEAWIAAGGGS